MGYTSTEVKNRYNKKVYSQWNVRLKNEYFEKIEKIREKECLSRSEFLEMLIDYKYSNSEK